MNVLERILEEIEEKRKGIIDMSDEEPELRDVEDWLEEGEKDGKMKAYQEMKGIIRSHIEHLPNVDTEEKSILCTVGEDGVLSEYDDTYDVVIHCTCKEDQEQTVKLIKDSNWIPVSERLPEDGTYLCTLDGELCGIDEPFTGMCGIENGKWDEEGCVIAWRPLPEPYRPTEE